MMLVTYLLVYFFYQLHLPLSLHSFNSDLSFHRRLAVWQLLNIHKPDRAPGAGVARAASLVVYRCAAHGVDCPARIVGPVGTFKDVTIEAHLTCAVFGDPP